MIKLKPCPFCGYKAVDMICVPRTVNFVNCRRCQAVGPNCQTAKAAANLWNECAGRKEKENE